ncbi:Nucleotide-binding universal stress protein, UspA family [Polaromonas sp. OV174]|uniref:universal stress protein n=1 Tax=Polaromonas sp. OV174 TaxID=1855300 RepID=UPI0008E749C3|nr:universal stress protein [Polaromonas sp. OV174]SFB86926.1 Nucleotide-binding universal stress protein, UspA family [Polaromonas sp. OV174]
MRNILVPIDPTQPARTRSAIDQVVCIFREEPVTVRLLRVQPQVSGHVAMFFDKRELRELQQGAGAEDLQFAQNLLDAAGVPYTSTVLVGRSAETIIVAARDHGCDRIVFGREEPSLAGKIFGSLAQQVHQLLGASGDPQVIGS